MIKYKSYKPSGVEWIGEIPEHWGRRKLKSISEYITEKGIPGMSDIKISPENVEQNTGVCLNLHSDYTNEGVKFKKGDILFNKLRVYLSKVVITNYNGYSMGEMIVVRPKEIDNKYLFHLMLSHGFIDWCNSFHNGVKLPRVSPEVIFNSLLPLPPKSEQLLIVQFLDEKTEIIDKLISTKERKIELLKQQRTSLINQVITKGLDPNVKMKDSGVEWIGEMPEHWDCKSLKYAVKCNDKALNEDTDPNYKLNYIEIGDVDSSGNINNSTPYLFKNAPSRCRRILSKGDVLVSSVRTYLKSIGYIKNEVSDLICSTGFCVLTPKEIIISMYLFYQILTEYFIGNVISKSYGVSYPSITSTELIKIKILVPSITEQQKIVKHLDKRTNEIDDLISMEQKKMDLLKEYRQSLISEVITGKIDVRNN